MVELFKDGNVMAIKTDCINEVDFNEQFSDAVHSMIEDNRFEHDWAFQFATWLPQYAEICCVFRGYKSANVHKHQVLIAGETHINGLELIAKASTHKKEEKGAKKNG